VRRVISFSDIQATDAVGEKAGNLSLLFRSRFPVPPGFVIAADAFRLEGDQDPALWTFPEPLRQEIEAAFHEAGNLRAAVRSSCSAEDLADASFAGQYESMLNVTEANLMEAIRHCWLSAYQGHASFYKTQSVAAGGRTSAMSVIVQEFIEADASGVIFSKNPITGNEDEIVVNAGFGLGEAIVSGLTTPDCFVLPKQGTSIRDMQLGDKECKTVLDDSGGTRLVETTAAEKAGFSLRENQLQELKNMTLAIEALFGFPVDLEFAYRQDQLYILQARQITT